MSTPQTFSDFLHYCALLLSARTDPVHTEQRSKALRQLKTSYKDDEWEAFHQSFIELCGTFSRNIGYGIYEDLFAVPFTQIGAASRTLKQDFTPADVGKLIGAISIPSKLLLPEEGFFSLGDQACGSGTLLLAGVQRFVSAPGRFCSFSPNRKCRKMAGKGVQPLDNYTCRFCLSSLKQADKSGLDRLQAGKLAGV